MNTSPNEPKEVQVGRQYLEDMIEGQIKQCDRTLIYAAEQLFRTADYHLFFEGFQRRRTSEPDPKHPGQMRYLPAEKEHPLYMAGIAVAEWKWDPAQQEFLKALYDGLSGISMRSTDSEYLPGYCLGRKMADHIEEKRLAEKKTA